MSKGIDHPIHEYHVVLHTMDCQVLEFKITFELFAQAFGKAVDAAISFAEDEGHEVHAVIHVTRKLIKP